MQRLSFLKTGIGLGAIGATSRQRYPGQRHLYCAATSSEYQRTALS